MYEIYSKVIDKLNSNQLEEIYLINNLKLHGFRIKGPSSSVKTQRMKNLLLKNSNLELIFKKTAETFSLQKDYTWALVSTVDENLVRNKIEDSNIGEVAYALTLANKLDLLRDILLNEEDGKTSIVQTKNRHNKVNEEESIVNNLREIIKSLEEKNTKLNSSLKTLKGEMVNLDQKNLNLKAENKEIKAELKNASNNYKQLKDQLSLKINELKKKEEEVIFLKENANKNKLEIEKLHKTRILFYGKNIYKKYVESKALSLDSLIVNYINNFEELEDHREYQKLVILTFTLNKDEIKSAIEGDIFGYFKELYNIVIISSLNQLNDYIAKVGRHYE
ncbi:hypothetical protein J22TS1_05180 [Siminovitchia terrae]|uniref:hypothetical protein n=1 Tax=Siminovitchia terrae TaxID=1914933 RepID=UPI001B247AE6|nr:hypothetical protein [Siminovitchia terrae]GIN89467.1 hypothetical protein J22TS1_05180 [Siminovitchia terrae]